MWVELYYYGFRIPVFRVKSVEEQDETVRIRSSYFSAFAHFRTLM